jgi:hypothetical protein
MAWAKSVRIYGDDQVGDDAVSQAIEHGALCRDDGAIEFGLQQFFGDLYPPDTGTGCDDDGFVAGTDDLLTQLTDTLPILNEWEIVSSVFNRFVMNPIECDRGHVGRELAAQLTL